jgi:hypothetical protein
MGRPISTVLVCSLLAGLLSACGGGSPTAPTGGVAGHWIGTLESADGPGTLDVRLIQSQRTVSGSMSLSQGGVSGVNVDLTGLLESAALPTTVQIAATYEYGLACRGSFGGTLIVTADSIQGPFTGSDCAHAFSGGLRLSRLP